MGLREAILNLMKKAAYEPVEVFKLAEMFGVDKSEYITFKKAVNGMIREGILFRDEKDKIGIASKMELIEGTLQVHQKGFGFVIRDEEDTKDIFIPKTYMGDALNGDRVAVEILKEDREGKRGEGKIVKVLERKNTFFVGFYEDNKSFGFVIPDDKRMTRDIFISKKDKNGAKTGDMVKVEITKWPAEGKKPEGKVAEILGKKGDIGIDILTVIKKFGLPEEFPEKVLDYAEGIGEEIPQWEMERRTDLRNLTMVTIDGEDAKDLDDAVSIEKLSNGMFKLGVHIADVSHYVRENNPLDKEALKRATSVYLVDRVIPMLPRKLSNGICSLNPKVDRLALSCIMTINKNGDVIDHEIHEAVIKTNERMTYTNVTKILVDKDEDLIKEYGSLVDDFKAMDELCAILNKKRMDRGAIDFDFAESKIILDEKGKPIDIKPYERGIANRIIEEFMLVCNETIAEHFHWLNIPFVYRVHEEPNNEKLEKFKEFIYNLGYKAKWGVEVHPKNLAQVIEMVKGKEEETVVSTLLLRSMMQAKYSPHNDGHFGLAAEYYSHFTSPIRRYPDLQIHRIIKEQINGKLDGKRVQALTTLVDVASKQSSDMERVAQEAEREVDDLKKAEYMGDRIGEIFDGIISSVTSFGAFVELPNTVEGLVHITELRDDYYIYDEAGLSLIGERHKKIYKLGDKVKVLCTRVDLDNKEVYFQIVEDKYSLEEKEMVEKNRRNK